MRLRSLRRELHAEPAPPPAGPYYDPALPAEVRTGAVRHVGNEVCISKTQRNVHVTFEALAVFAAAPFMLYLSQKPGLRDWERYGLYGITAATLIVDGGLLLSYLRKR